MVAEHCVAGTAKHCLLSEVVRWKYRVKLRYWYSGVFRCWYSEAVCSWYSGVLLWSYKWRLQMMSWRNWASLLSTVERRMNGMKWSFSSRSYVSLLSMQVASLLIGAEDLTIPDMSMSRIKTTLTNGIESSPETFSRLGDESERTSIESDPKNHGYKWIIDMACIGQEIRDKHSAENVKSHERKGLPFRAHSLWDSLGRMAQEHSQVGKNLRKPLQWVDEESYLPWQSTVRNAYSVSDSESKHLRVEWKQSLFKSCSTTRSIKQVWPYCTTIRERIQTTWRSMPWQKKAAATKEQGRAEPQRQKSSCSGCGQRYMNRECWFKDTNKVETTKDCWLSRNEPSNSKKKRGKRQCQKAMERTASTRSPPWKGRQGRKSRKSRKSRR